jgi:hypothetical protein
MKYLSTLANLTPTILLFLNVDNFKNYFFQIKKYCEDNSEYLGIFHFLKLIFQN